MKRLRQLTVAIGLLTAVSAAAAGQKAVAETSKDLKAQTRCPVMGGKIDSTIFTDIQGQRIYHCCGGCSEKLVADPDKYFQKAAAQGVLFENIQTICPVDGKPIDKRIYSDFEGRRVYFSSDKSREKFLHEPVKYLAKLPGQPKPNHKEEMDHDMHGGGRSGDGRGM